MNKIYLISMYFIFVLVFFNEFIKMEESVFTLFSIINMLFLLMSSIFLTKGFQLYVSLISLIFGHALLFYYNLGFEIWYESLMKTIGIPVLFVAIPMITFPIKHGKYLQSVESFIVSQKEKPIMLFSFLSILHLALTIPLNIGSIPTMQKLLGKINLPKSYLARLYTAGYSSYMVFSPYDPLVNMVLIWMGITYFDYFFSGFLMVLLIIIVSSLLLRLDKRLLDNLYSQLSTIQSTETGTKIYTLFVHILVLIVLAFLGVRFVPFSNQLFIISGIIVIYAILWGALLRVLNKYKKEFVEYGNHLYSFKTLIPFLISSSFFASIVSFTPIKESIGKLLSVINNFPMYFIIILVIFIIVILSLCGIHMMITVPALALTVTPELIGLSNVAFAITLLSCWYIAMSISPFVPFAVVVGDSIGEKPTHVTFKHNLKFSLIMLFMAPILILLINYLSL